MVAASSIIGVVAAGLGALCFSAQGPTSGAGPMTLRDDLPIDVSAERCEVFENEDAVRCNGNVRVRQADAILTGDVMTIIGLSEEGGFRRIEAVGNVRYASGTDAISGARGVYDAPTTTVTVTGDVVAITKDQIMTGGELIYNTETGRTVFSAGSKGRVRGLFYTADADR